MTILELIIIIAVLGIVAAIMIPRYGCAIQKSRMAEAMEDLERAKGQIEAFKAELGRFPPSLEAAYGDQRPPEDLFYCIDLGDGNAGHGNEWCSFFDPDNPSGNAPVGSLMGIGYILRTKEELALSCQGVNFAWVTCCGREPQIAGPDDKTPGHPGNPGGKK